MKRTLALLTLLGLAAARPVWAQHCTLDTTLSLGADGTIYAACWFSQSIVSWAPDGTYLSSLPVAGALPRAQWAAGRLLVAQVSPGILAQYGLAGYQNQVALDPSTSELAFDPATGIIFRNGANGLQIFGSELKLLHQIPTDSQGVSLSGGSMAVVGSKLYYAVGNNIGTTTTTTIYTYSLKPLENGIARQTASFQAPVNFSFGGQMAADAAGNLYLCQNANQVVKVNHTGKIVLTLSLGATEGCDGIAVDANGTIYAAGDDNANGEVTTIHVFNAQGTQINSFN